MSKRAYIIHGWEGSPDIDWFNWLKGELEKNGFKVELPFMPNTNHPKSTEWISYLSSLITNPNQETFLIGHSLGVITILRYLESLPAGQRIGGAVLVAGFPEQIGYPELISFFNTPLDYDKIKNTANHFVAIHSDNDPFVPLKNGEVLRDKLGAELVVLPNAGHINQSSGFSELPIVLDSVLKISK